MKPDVPAIVIVAESELANLATQINEAHDHSQHCMRESVASALQAGRLLLQAKSRVSHGGWLLWVRDNVDFSERTVQAYMKIATNWEAIEANTQRVADLSVRQVLALLADSEEDVKPVVTQMQEPVPMVRVIQDPSGVKEPTICTVRVVQESREPREYTTSAVVVHRDMEMEDELPDSLQDVMQRAVELRDQLTKAREHLLEARKLIREVFHSAEGVHLQRRGMQIKDVNNLITILAKSMPVAVGCPVCRGNFRLPCVTCSQTNIITKTLYDQCDSEFRSYMRLISILPEEEKKT